MKKFLSLLLAIAQFGVIAPAVMAEGNVSSSNNTSITQSFDELIPVEEASPLSENMPLTYSVDQMLTESGEPFPVNTAIPASDFNRYGITADTSGTIWSVQRIDPVNYVGVEGLRFSSQSFSSKQKTLMSMNFADDVVNNPPAFNGSGYVYESEFMIQVKDTGAYISLDINGKTSDGTSAKIGEIRFALNGTAKSGQANSASVYAVNSYGAKIGNTVTVKATSSKSFDYSGELLFLRAKIDFLNKKFSAWVIPRKDENGEYSAAEPTSDNLIVENADMINSSAVEFTGFDYVLNNSSYGNAVWIKNMSIDEYSPEEIIATPTPTAGHEEGIALKIAVLSDTQYGRASQDSSSTLEYAGKKFKAALNQVVEKAGGLDQLDVLMIPGDISHNSNTDEFDAFIEDLSEVIPPGSHTKVLFLRGNHDAKPGKESNFVTAMSKYDPTITSPNNVYDIYGYKFIMVSQDTQRSNDEASTYPYIHSPETIAWFDSVVKQASAEAAEEGKPIFVCMHPNVKDTVYGSFPVTGMRNGEEYISSYWATSELYDSLKDCYNAITFSGHSHWDIANVRSIHQEDFTSLNTGSVNNLEIEDCWDESFQPKRFGSNENESSGYYIEVGTDNKVTIHKLDLYRQREFGDPWIVDVNDKENWEYTDDRDQNPPYFEEGAVANVSDIDQTTCKVTFTQGKDNENAVGHYKLELINQETGNADKTFTISSYYWQCEDMPAENYWNVTGLDSGTQYKAVITAYDQFYQASSNTLESDVFTTTERPVTPAALTKISFTDEGIQDTSEYARFYNLEPRTYGTTPVSYNSDLNMYEATFERNADDSNSPNFFKVLFDEGRKELMQGSDGYTIDVMFSPSQLNNANNIIGIAQSSGFDIETTSDGTLETYLRHNGKWVDPCPGSTLKVETDTYYHITVTYDGSVIKVYNNGELIDSVSASGDLEFFAKDDPNLGLVIGGDYNPITDDTGAYVDQTSAQNAFSGKIVFANVYSGAFTAKEVSRLNSKYEARKTLTKADELNSLLTGGTLTADLEKEGWELMGDENLTDEAITEFINKAQSGKAVNYSLYASNVATDENNNVTPENYGIFRFTDSIWGVVKENSVNTCYVDALRFSTKSNLGTADLMTLTFADDLTNNPEGIKFENGKYIYESEMSVLYKDNGYVDLHFTGTDSSDTSVDFATLRFAMTSGAYRYTSDTHFINNEGEKIGNSIPFQLSSDDGSTAVTVVYLRMEIDMQNNTYTAYLVPRKTSNNAYTGASVSPEWLLAEDVPFNNAANVFDGIRVSISGSSGTNAYWLNNIEVSGSNADTALETKADIVYDGTNVTANVTNGTDENMDLSLYFAQYDINGKLIGIVKADKIITAGTQDSIPIQITFNENADQYKAFLWNSDMESLACEIITKTS